jgi:hypothetical protein
MYKKSKKSTSSVCKSKSRSSHRSRDVNCPMTDEKYKSLVNVIGYVYSNVSTSNTVNAGGSHWQ